MINRKDIEAILKINGVESSSPDEKIRSVLMSARYNKDEVDTAIMVLRENTVTKSTRVDGLHKIFRSNESLRPDEISQLLGIEVDISQTTPEESRNPKLSRSQFVFVCALSIIVAIIGVIFYMYLHKVGVFHDSFALAHIK